MKIYVRDILSSNEDTKEQYKIIEQSMYIQNKTGVEQELVITPQSECYLESNSDFIGDFMQAYVEVEAYNRAIYKAVVECEFRIRYYAYLKEYYAGLKLSQKDSQELEKYKKRYKEYQESARKFEEELYKASKQVEEKNKEILSLRRELEYYKGKEKETNSTSNKDKFEDNLPFEFKVAMTVLNNVFGGLYDK